MSTDSTIPEEESSLSSCDMENRTGSPQQFAFAEGQTAGGAENAAATTPLLEQSVTYSELLKAEDKESSIPRDLVDKKTTPAPLPTDADIEDLEARRAVEELQQFIASPAFEDHQAQSIFRLQQELRWAMQELKEKDQKCERLSSMQEKVDKEIHELTTSLFQEAYVMVNEAKSKQALAEKLLREANGKIEVLQTELSGLKRKLAHANSSSTPPMQGYGSPAKSRSGSIFSPFSDDRRFSFSAGFSPFSRRQQDAQQSAGSATTSPQVESQETEEEKEMKKQLEFKEIDPTYHKELVNWREKHDLTDMSQPFLQHIYVEEILPCLNFVNKELAKPVLEAVERNSIVIERLLNDKPVAKVCDLCQVPRICNFRFKVSEQAEEWYYISQLCRNRIASVCDFYTYLRYLSQGIIKCGVHDAYWEVIKLRRNIALARLGLGFASIYQKI